MRASIVYGDAKPSISDARQVDVPVQGLFKIRLKKGGPWVPVRVYVEDGDRDPETWDLLSDQKWHAEWAPRTDSDRLYPAPYARIINSITQITKEEFEWLMILRRLPSHHQLPKR